MMAKLEINSTWAVILKSVHVGNEIQCYVNYVSVFAAILQDHINPRVRDDQWLHQKVNGTLDALGNALYLTQHINDTETAGMDRIRSMYHMSLIPKYLTQLMTDCNVEVFLGCDDTIVQFLERMDLYINEPSR